MRMMEMVMKRDGEGDREQRIEEWLWPGKGKGGGVV